ncbi:MAG: hypothetical protein ACKOK8_04215 [Planctomycetia bacterium]
MRHLISIIRTGAALRVVRRLMATALLALATDTGSAREAAMPRGESAAMHATPGAIGAWRRPQFGPRPESMLPHDVQPVEIRGPEGMRISIETAEGWSPVRAGPLRMGLVVGRPYRLRLTGIPGHEGREVFPSIRVLAKLATPPGMAWRFPVEIVVDADDLTLALAGSHVRRIVYSACDPDLPDVVPEGWFDVRPGDDCLDVATTLGDPVAEVIIGNRLPTGFVGVHDPGAIHE